MDGGQATEGQRQVRRRRVFYIPGYDPIAPRRYRELYRKEGAAQAAISGYALELLPAAAGGSYGWQVRAQIEGAETQSDIEVLVWADLVRASMSNGIPATYLQMLRTAWTYLATGTLRRLFMLRKGPVIAALYPVGMLLVQLLVAALAGLFAARIVGGALRLLPVSGAAMDAIIAVLSLAAALLALVAVLRWFRARDNRLFAYYLMHDYAHSAQAGGAYSPDLEDRMAAFAGRIAAALADDVDEVLVVGHSSGAHLAVSILADLLRAGRVPPGGPALG
ncbi:MAG: hypothetical protein KDK29_13165, partial [Sedimentitalea sp.]|nr:hypothetical protein [Sedimentitalea sp.]